MSFTLYRPETVEEAVNFQTEFDGKYLAGGTVALVQAHRRMDIGAHQISLAGIGKLKEIRLKDNVLSIGSMVTMTELEESVTVKNEAFALWQAASEVGGPQIRNLATIGGNLAAASPSSDCATPLLSLGARLVVFGKNGYRTIEIRNFFLGRFHHVLSPDELIVSVDIPCVSCRVSAFRKVGKRNALAVSCINMAIVREGGKIDVSVGAAAPKTVYCEKTSAFLTEHPEGIKEAAEILKTEICPIDDRWASASYRLTVSENLLKELLKETEEDK